MHTPLPLPPLLGCFPVFTLFAALFVLIVLVMLIGMGKHEASESTPDEQPSSRMRYPSWWALALIPVALAAIIWFLAWCTAGN